MCAIFGFVARGKSAVSIQTLANIVRGNIVRGPHSFGFAWIDAAGRLRCFKQCGRLTDTMGVLAMARGARLLIGHLRWATHGDARENINNHPHPCDGGWIVHNGVVKNYDALVKRSNVYPVSECDSEILGLLAERSEARSAMRRCAEAVEATTGKLAMMGLWTRPASLVVARRGNPLSISETVDGVYLATLPSGLPRAAKGAAAGALRDNTIRVYTRDDKGGIRCKAMKLDAGDNAGGDAAKRASLFDETNYRGG